jgi:integrase/recombinase XerD
MSVPGPSSRQPKPLAAGVFQPEIGSFRLCLAAEGKSGKTVRMYTEAVQWFVAAHLIPRTSRTRWEQVSGQDIQRWMVWLLGRYSDSYASNQYRALQQFFKCWVSEEDLPDPMVRLRPPRVTEKLIPLFTGGKLSKLEKVCAGRSFAQRRDQAVIAVFRATGVRLSELAGIVYDAQDAQHSDVDLWQREIRVRGKAARRGSSGSATRPPSPLTATSGSGPGTPRHTGRNCGWGSTTGAR